MVSHDFVPRPHARVYTYCSLANAVHSSHSQVHRRSHAASPRRLAAYVRSMKQNEDAIEYRLAIITIVQVMDG